MVMLIAWGSLFNKGKRHFIYANPITINTRLNNYEISVAIAAPFIAIQGNPNFPNISR